MNRDKKISLLIKLFLFVFGVFLLFHPPTDPDFGWHYKIGEYIFKSHRILRENIFSYTFANYKWADSYWLSEIIMYVLYTYTSGVGMSLILSIILSIFAVLILDSTDFENAGKFLAGTLFFTFSAAALVSVRPLYFSTIFTLLLCFILLYKKLWIKFLPVLFLFWANMHADFSLGLFILSAYIFFELCGGLFDKTLTLKKVFSFAAIFALSVFATFITPWGILLWKTVFKETHYYQFMHISEWLPFSIDKAGFVQSISMFALTGLIAGSALLSRKKFGNWYVFTVAFFFLLSLRSIYFARVFAVIGIFGVGNIWGFILTHFLNKFDTNVKKYTGFVICGMFGLILLIAANDFAANLILASENKLWAKEKEYPYEAVSFIKQHPIEGNMFNNFNWGGYLIWQLPQYKTFVDGRMDSWREGDHGIFQDYVSFKLQPEKNIQKFNDYVSKYEITWVLDNPKSKFVTYLKKNGWEAAYEDKAAIILTSR